MLIWPQTGRRTGAADALTNERCCKWRLPWLVRPRDRWLSLTHRSTIPNVRTTASPTRTTRNSTPIWLATPPLPVIARYRKMRGQLDITPAGITGKTLLQPRLQLPAEICAYLSLRDTDYRNGLAVRARLAHIMKSSAVPDELLCKPL